MGIFLDGRTVLGEKDGNDDAYLGDSNFSSPLGEWFSLPIAIPPWLYEGPDRASLFISRQVSARKSFDSRSFEEMTTSSSWSSSNLFMRWERECVGLRVGDSDGENDDGDWLADVVECSGESVRIGPVVWDSGK